MGIEVDRILAPDTQDTAALGRLRPGRARAEMGGRGERQGAGTGLEEIASREAGFHHAPASRYTSAAIA